MTHTSGIDGSFRPAAGGTDDQSPHTEDEIYVVTAGRARIATPREAADVGPGSVIFVPAAEEHRFIDVAEDLAPLVVRSRVRHEFTKIGQPLNQRRRP